MKIVDNEGNDITTEIFPPKIEGFLIYDDQIPIIYEENYYETYTDESFTPCGYYELWDRP